MSEHIFAWRTTTTARLTDDAEAMGEFRCHEFRCQSMNSGSECLFAWRTTTTARLTDDAEAMGNDLDPVLCTVGPAGTDDRTPSNSLAGCSPRTFRRQRARRSGSGRPSCSHSGNESRMGSACPAPWQRWLDQVDSHRIGHHRGPHRVGLDVPQNDEQVVAALDDRG